MSRMEQPVEDPIIMDTIITVDLQLFQIRPFPPFDGMDQERQAFMVKVSKVELL